MNDDVHGIVGEEAVTLLGLVPFFVEGLFQDQQLVLALAQVERNRADDNGSHCDGDHPGRSVADAEAQKGQSRQRNHDREASEDSHQSDQRLSVATREQPGERMPIGPCRRQGADEQKERHSCRDRLTRRRRDTDQIQRVEHVTGDRNGGDHGARHQERRPHHVDDPAVHANQGDPRCDEKDRPRRLRARPSRPRRLHFLHGVPEPHGVQAERTPCRELEKNQHGDRGDHCSQHTRRVHAANRRQSPLGEDGRRQ
jgi:hypothetical protein